MRNLLWLILLVIGPLSTSQSLREINLQIVAEFPPNEKIYAQVATFNGQDVRDKAFLPGTYHLEVRCPGFYPVIEYVELPAGKQPFLLKRTLRCKPRSIDDNITFDIRPPASLVPHRITFAPAEHPHLEQQVREGDVIKPGVYIMRIVQQAYQTVEFKKYVWPTDQPLIINEKLHAKHLG